MQWSYSELMPLTHGNQFYASQGLSTSFSVWIIWVINEVFVIWIQKQNNIINSLLSQTLWEKNSFKIS